MQGTSLSAAAAQKGKVQPCLVVDAASIKPGDWTKYFCGKQLVLVKNFAAQVFTYVHFDILYLSSVAIHASGWQLLSCYAAYYTSYVHL